MAWRRIGDKPLSEPMLTRPLRHICAALGGDELMVLQISWYIPASMHRPLMTWYASNRAAIIPHH